MPIRGEHASSVVQRSKAGHPEILGETLAKFEFFENGWNPYSRFLDVDKVDLILRRRDSERVIYREVQVKYGKLFEVRGWEREHFDFSTFRFFKENEFAGQLDQRNFFVAYVVSRERGYQGDIFVFPVRHFMEKIRCAPIIKGQRRRVLISRLKGESEQWVLRRTNHRFTKLTDEVCVDVSRYRRNFALLESN
jgi:hypothetical protein